MICIICINEKYWNMFSIKSLLMKKSDTFWFRCNKHINYYNNYYFNNDYIHKYIILSYDNKQFLILSVHYIDYI